jgi:hypothetical protein
VPVSGKGVRLPKVLRFDLYIGFSVFLNE